jgi:GNAT superfamily N-acetyltransferase
MTELLEAGLAVSPESGYMHPGDLQYRAFRSHGFPLAELIEVWEDDGGIVGFGFLHSDHAYCCQVAPDRRGSGLEVEIMAWCQEGTLTWRRENGLEPACIVDVHADDAVRIAILEGMGYRRSDVGLVSFQRDLDDIAEPALPSGFVVRGLRPEDVDSRATCGAEAFGSTKTTPQTWRALMAGAPGYDADLDTVVVASDGTVASSALAWLDRANRIGLFEPVATRPSFEGQGCGKAALLRGLHAMRDHGMTRAFVSTTADNVSAQAAYRSVGFAVRNNGFEFGWQPA